MPARQPNWENVSFDYEAAQAAIAECEAAVRVIDDSLHAEAGQRGEATTEWSGLARGEFDRAAQQLWGLREQLRDQLKVLAAVIAAAAQAARAEQARREADRERWHEKRAVEKRRAALAAELGSWRSRGEIA